ncbi:MULTISPECIES: TetR/AcrR family transcriptional regulator [Amycolatopsis]|uniref:TetR family transcriptional regulator n=1 Tax=Amycolatopsis thermalba TaxID=944492 RepID=A0ABY4P3A1_9PSEU|nr:MULTISPECIES: TetR family transcriptional regulator [Amycolatopsis]OXM71028.1 TetR family transcriptional regulator [Amycolatopsis sp. KNN50.9b]UQS26747.1 TetR family transcriptional regulator [Amycolatopsis thermalba]
MAKSAPVPGRPRSRDAAGLPAVTPDRIIDAALELTARHGVESWTLRQLAGAVDAYPAVIYHHVGDRDTVVTAVVDRVIAMYELPPAELEWRPWWRQFLTNLRVVFMRYPGVARRVALNGPSVKAGGPTVDRAMRTLLRAGFEQDEAAMVCRLLVSQACLFISLEDDQRKADEAKAQISGGWGAPPPDPNLSGLATLAETVHERLHDPEKNRDYFAELFDYAVDRVLDGVQVRLEEIKRAS